MTFEYYFSDYQSEPYEYDINLTKYFEEMPRDKFLKVFFDIYNTHMSEKDKEEIKTLGEFETDNMEEEIKKCAEEDRYFLIQFLEDYEDSLSDEFMRELEDTFESDAYDEYSDQQEGPYYSSRAEIDSFDMGYGSVPRIGESRQKPFLKKDAGNVEYNAQVFNAANGNSLAENLEEISYEIFAGADKEDAFMDYPKEVVDTEEEAYECFEKLSKQFAYVEIEKKIEDNGKTVSVETIKTTNNLLQENRMNMTLQKLADSIKVTGPSHLGARMPEFNEYAINESRIPHNMRYKNWKTEVFTFGTINEIELTWETQDPFTSKDADVLINEIERAIGCLIDRYDYNEPFTVVVEVIARDGKDEGYAVVDLDFNKNELTEKLHLDEGYENRCERCNARLSDNGECPVCDHGEEDLGERLNESFDAKSAMIEMNRLFNDFIQSEEDLKDAYQSRVTTGDTIQEVIISNLYHGLWTDFFSLKYNVKTDEWRSIARNFDSNKTYLNERGIGWHSMIDFIQSAALSWLEAFGFDYNKLYSLNEDSLSEGLSDTYTLVYYDNDAGRERRPETLRDIKKGWHEVKFRADDDLSACEEAFVRVYEDDPDEYFDTDATVKDFVDYFESADWSDGSPILIRLSNGINNIYDSGYTKQTWANEFMSESENEDMDESKYVLNEADDDRVSATIPADLLNNPDAVDFKSYIGKRSADAKAEKERQEKAARVAERAAKYKDLLTRVRDMEAEQPSDRLQVLFEELVPPQGNAETVAGEIVRAMMRILYRDFNDGDVFYEGYGLETCSGSVAYLIDVLGDEFIDDFEGIALRELHDDSYTRELEKIADKVVNAILSNEEYIASDNEEDSRSGKWEDDYEDRFKDDWEPKYEYSFEVADKIHEHILEGNITMQDVISRMEDNLMYQSGFDGVEVYSDGMNLTMENLTREALEELEYWDRDSDQYWSDYIDELNDEFGDPDDYDEDDDYEEEDDEDMDESLDSDDAVYYGNGEIVPEGSVDMDKALDYQFGTDRNPDNSTFTRDEKQRAIDYWEKKHLYD